jgi:hypothetical protein
MKVEAAIRKALQSSDSKEWSSWDDVSNWVENNVDEIGGQDVAQEVIDTVECMKQDGIEFEKDPHKTAGILKKHHKQHREEEVA